MRAGLLLPACIVLSAIVHMLLVAAVAVPRQTSTAHGESIAVDIVPANEVPDLPEVPESAPSAGMPEPAPAGGSQQDAPSQQAQAASPPQQQRPQSRQLQQQPQQRPQQPQSQQQQQQQQSQPQAARPQPEQPTVAQPAPGSTLAEQHDRLVAMLNLPGPGSGDGSGAEADTKAHLTSQEITAFRTHLKSCWQLPQGVSPNQRLKIIVRMSLRQNGSLATDPALIEAAVSPTGPPLVQAAMKAIKQCQPYSMLPSAKYKEWRVLDINFSPDEMAGN